MAKNYEQVVQEFGEAVNISAGELEDWLETEESQQVGASTGEVSRRRAIMVAIISTCAASSVAVSMIISRYLAGPR